MNISSNIASIQNTQATSATNVANAMKDHKVDLAKEIHEQITAQRSTEVNISAIKAQDEILGSLLDMKA